MCVRFKKFNLVSALKWEDVFILQDLDQQNESVTDTDSDWNSDEEVNVSVTADWELGRKIGIWEKHTKVID